MVFQKTILKEIFASKTLNIKKEVERLLCYIDSLTSQNFQMADRVWNCPIMYCKPLTIDYVMYALYCSLGLFPKKKNWPLKQVFRGHFGPQVKFYGWNSVLNRMHNWLIDRSISQSINQINQSINQSVSQSINQ